MQEFGPMLERRSQLRQIYHSILKAKLLTSRRHPRFGMQCRHEYFALQSLSTGVDYWLGLVALFPRRCRLPLSSVMLKSTGFMQQLNPLGWLARLI